METIHETTPGSPVEILFVDDEKNVLQSLKRLFIDENYTVIIANSGEEALEVLKDNPNIGLIISDQRMPGMKGSEFLEKAREILPDAIRMLLTGYADINAVADAINKGGASRYITKPWNDEELLQTMADAARRYSLIKENKRLQGIIQKQNEELKRWNSQLEYFVQEQTVEIQNKSKELEKLNENLKHNFRNSILAFSGLIELRDKKTANHSKNVAELSVRIAKAMQLPDDKIKTVMIAALLHDIGKIGIPDSLFAINVENLDADGMKQYMQHSVRGQAAIDQVEDLRDAGVLIRHHHEWYNGTGFPDKLSGDHIPLGARIICLADFIDRTINTTAESNPLEYTLKRVVKDLGIQFDLKFLNYYEKPARELYSEVKHTATVVEVELKPDKLQPGMILSRDVKSGTGLTLLIKGITLNGKHIESIKRYYQLDPSETGIFVLIKR
ncbi:MAG: response regulator [Nitrospiraceae bacterium]|nr:MAG: response regulator [Nitrospiraceae bacterium]